MATPMDRMFRKLDAHSYCARAFIDLMAVRACIGGAPEVLSKWLSRRVETDNRSDFGSLMAERLLRRIKKYAQYSHKTKIALRMVEMLRLAGVRPCMSQINGAFHDLVAEGRMAQALILGAWARPDGVGEILNFVTLCQAGEGKNGIEQAQVDWIARFVDDATCSPSATSHGSNGIENGISVLSWSIWRCSDKVIRMALEKSHAISIHAVSSFALRAHSLPVSQETITLLERKSAPWEGVIEREDLSPEQRLREFAMLCADHGLEEKIAHAKALLFAERQCVEITCATSECPGQAGRTRRL